MKIFLTLLMLLCIGYWLFLLHWSLPVFFFSLLGVLYFEGEDRAKQKAELEAKKQEETRTKPRTGESTPVRRRSIAQGRPSIHKTTEE